MKKFGKILMIGAAIMVMIQSLSAAGERGGTDPVSGKDKDLFVFKANRKLVGGKVEVLSSKGEVVTSQMLQKRKIVIDFGDVAQDDYTIRVTKGHRVEEHRYIKE